ncbi:zinc finger and BTB domain-containing protein 49 [Wyeomyia smithii]|uniref:zinc finger and BTB domain-containing protein 49 n=1 Tax=Wyeomyia smithii TaxID=174621 RepID=UPI00246821AF|nr:zinc finger and BTB domain-containing protein 49 [Wyeomyia smithii]
MFTNWLAPPPTTTLPPDTIIEVGPPPFTRYAAHSALVSAHSGYLRAALRSDRSSATVTDTIPIYVPNVTTDQFTPLLAYMYTGFLDLNLENIFGVLLATHILHMPRALELCRAFLSATQQTENYFGGLGSLSGSAGTSGHSLSKVKPESETCSSSSKVVRPIASKATGIGLNFIAPPTSHISLPSTNTQFKSLLTVSQPTTAVVENIENSTPPLGNAIAPSSSETTVTTDNEQSVPRPVEVSKPLSKESNQKQQSKSLKRNVSKSESVVTTVAKDANGTDKGVIIDIASCDGPVRFRRVLNDSYGTNSTNNIICISEESKGHSRYMSSSFHQQMVRNINERKQHQTTHESYGCGSTKDENSQDNNQLQGTVSVGASDGTGGEMYNCVYCKHTFKSQYCYQKHAKRHLIPLSMETGSTTNNNSNVILASLNDSGDKETLSTRHRKTVLHCGSAKREVKPLDMNVQYYPCKTCGSKFPSYYFVHKHRKMCHVDEEMLSTI